MRAARHLMIFTKRLRLLGTMALVLVLLVFPTGCTTTVVAPAKVQRPVTVYLLDHGITPSLVLPAKGDRMVRYMYGDWEWYARGNQNAWRGFLALFVPTQGALGRDEFPAVKSADALRDALAVGFDEVFEIEVERERAVALSRDIESQFNSAADTSILNEGNRARFAHHPQSYIYFANSNHMVAAWLRELGCETRGPAFYSSWKVKPARTDERR